MVDRTVLAVAAARSGLRRRAAGSREGRSRSVEGRALLERPAGHAACGLRRCAAGHLALPGRARVGGARVGNRSTETARGAGDRRRLVQGCPDGRGQQPRRHRAGAHNSAPHNDRHHHVGRHGGSAPACRGAGAGRRGLRLRRPRPVRRRCRRRGAAAQHAVGRVHRGRRLPCDRRLWLQRPRAARRFRCGHGGRGGGRAAPGGRWTS